MAVLAINGRQLWLTVGLATLLLATAGCPSIGFRPLRDPGPAEFQRRSDAYWDPYPSSGTYMTGIEDTRPRDFARPVSEVKQAQSTPFKRPRSGQTTY